MGICKLCNKEKQLIKKSHILSEFLHANLFDEHHKLYKFEVNEMAKPNPRVSKPSSGSYEGDLLCNDCDNVVLNRYEDYIARAQSMGFSDERNPKCKFEKRNGVNFHDIENLDYEKTKLFLLSLLWRAHISSFSEYSEVSLKPADAEKIREMLLNQHSSNDQDIQISIFKFEKGSGFDSFIGQPIGHEIENSPIYSIIINGHLVVFHLTENRISKATFDVRLKENGSISMVEIPKAKVEDFVMRYTGAKK